MFLRHSSVFQQWLWCCELLLLYKYTFTQTLESVWWQKVKPMMSSDDGRPSGWCVSVFTLLINTILIILNTSNQELPTLPGRVLRRLKGFSLWFPSQPRSLPAWACTDCVLLLTVTRTWRSWWCWCVSSGSSLASAPPQEECLWDVYSKLRHVNEHQMMIIIQHKE